MYKIKRQVSMNNEQKMKMKTETDLLNLSALMTGEALMHSRVGGYYKTPVMIIRYPRLSSDNGHVRGRSRQDLIMVRVCRRPLTAASAKTDH